MQVLVRDNNVDQALKALKKKMQREGIFREMKLRGHYEKPSEKKAREKAEAVRRARKLARKKLQREGLLPMKPKPVFGAGPGAERGGAAAAVAVPAPVRADRADTDLCRFESDDAGLRVRVIVFDRCILRRGGLPMRRKRASILQTMAIPVPRSPSVREPFARLDWRAACAARIIVLATQRSGGCSVRSAGHRGRCWRSRQAEDALAVKRRSPRSNRPGSQRELSQTDVAGRLRRTRAPERWPRSGQDRSRRWPSSTRRSRSIPHNAEACTIAACSIRAKSSISSRSTISPRRTA